MKLFPVFCMLFTIPVLSQCSPSPPPFRPDLTKVARNPKKTLPFFSGKHMDPVWPQKNAKDKKLRQLKSFRLISSSGRTVSRESMRGKILIVSFFYTTCAGVCPRLVSNLKSLVPAVKKARDVEMVSFSVDPERDTPEKISAFKKMHGVETNKWIFLTGEKKQLYDIARTTFNADTVLLKNKRRYDFVHSELVYLLDKDHYLRAIYRGRGTAAIPLILKDIGRLRKQGI